LQALRDRKSPPTQLIPQNSHKMLKRSSLTIYTDDMLYLKIFIHHNYI